MDIEADFQRPLPLSFAEFELQADFFYKKNLLEPVVTQVIKRDDNWIVLRITILKVKEMVCNIPYMTLRFNCFIAYTGYKCLCLDKFKVYIGQNHYRPRAGQGTISAVLLKIREAISC
jgi:hypothetical protein